MTNKLISYNIPPMQYWTDCEEMTQSGHLLIAGSTGSGKSVLLNSCIYSILKHSPVKAQFAFIDLKYVELANYKKLPHTLAYCTELQETINLLDACIYEMKRRYNIMALQGKKTFDGSTLYIVIDELADLLLTDKSTIKNQLQKIALLGRACKVQLICCTQCPNKKTIPANIIENFTNRVALRCMSAVQSRQILEIKGAENLPRYGQGILRNGYGYTKIAIPMTPETDIINRCQFWEQATPKKIRQ